MENLYKYNDGDKIRLIPDDVQDTVDMLKKYYHPNSKCYVMDYPPLIKTAYEKTDMSEYYSMITKISKHYKGQSIFFKKETPQEIRNKSRLSLQKKLKKVKDENTIR